MHPPRTILHVDMDAFYASVEQLRNPELRGKPVIVGGPGARGVVAAASYEARVFGIHSAMPSTQAQRLCPHAVFVAGDHEHYGEISQRVMAIFTSFTPLVEAISLDEAFLDVTGRPPAPRRRPHDRRQDPGRGARAGGPHLLGGRGAVEVRGQAGLRGGQAPHRAARPGAGARREGRRGRRGARLPPPAARCRRCGASARRPSRSCTASASTPSATWPSSTSGLPSPPLGAANGAHLRRLAMGIDDRDVVPHQRAKSIGHEETFAHDHHRLDSLQHELVRLGDSVAGRLRSARHGGAHGHHQGAVPRLPHHHPVDHAAVGGRHRPRRRAGRHGAARRGSIPPPGCGCSASTSASWPTARPPAQPRRRRGALLGRRHRGHRRHPGPLRRRRHRAGVAGRPRRASGSRSGATSSGDRPIAHAL